LKDISLECKSPCPKTPQENCTPVFLINIDAKISAKMPGNLIQQDI
jgi:hypothetical protein